MSKDHNTELLIAQRTNGAEMAAATSNDLWAAVDGFLETGDILPDKGGSPTMGLFTSMPTVCSAQSKNSPMLGWVG